MKKSKTQAMDISLLASKEGKALRSSFKRVIPAGGPNARTVAPLAQLISDGVIEKRWKDVRAKSTRLATGLVGKLKRIRVKKYKDKDGRVVPAHTRSVPQTDAARKVAQRDSSARERNAGNRNAEAHRAKLEAKRQAHFRKENIKEARARLAKNKPKPPLPLGLRSATILPFKPRA